MEDTRTIPVHTHNHSDIIIDDGPVTNDYIWPPWTAILMASIILIISIFIYGWLRFAQEKVEVSKGLSDLVHELSKESVSSEQQLEVEEDHHENDGENDDDDDTSNGLERTESSKSQTTTTSKRLRRVRRNIYGKSTNRKNRISKSIWEAPLTRFDKWVLKHGSELRNFILSAMVFFAIPNLYLMGGMQMNFLGTLIGGLLGLAILLSTAICFGILFYSSFGSPMEEWCHTKFVARNKYEHLGLPLIDIVVLGVGQVTLIALYFWSLADAGSPDFSNKRDSTFYILGILMQVAYGHDKKIWKSVRNHACFWISTLRTLHKNDEYEGYVLATVNNTEKMFNLREHSHLYVRFFISSVVNVTGLFIIMMGLPLQVATQPVPMDFVLNVVAGFYIVEWDDLDESEQVQFTCVTKASREDWLASNHSAGKGVDDSYLSTTHETRTDHDVSSRQLDLVSSFATPTTPSSVKMPNLSKNESTQDKIDRLTEEFTALNWTLETKRDEMSKLAEHLRQLGKDISDLSAEANPPVFNEDGRSPRDKPKKNDLVKTVSFQCL